MLIMECNGLAFSCNGGKRVVEWTLFEALSLVHHLHIITSFCCLTETILLPIVVRPSEFAAVFIPDWRQGAHYYLQWMTLPWPDHFIP